MVSSNLVSHCHPETPVTFGFIIRSSGKLSIISEFYDCFCREEVKVDDNLIIERFIGVSIFIRSIRLWKSDEDGMTSKMQVAIIWKSDKGKRVLSIGKATTIDVTTA